MGHREELLSAARQCLIERGYARTTARDLVAASNTNLASIGYHFGSKDELLAQALENILAEYTGQMLDLVNTVSVQGDARDAVTAVWLKMTDLNKGTRPLAVAFVEALAQTERSKDLHERLAESYEDARRRIVDTILTQYGDLPKQEARAIASFFMCVGDGYLLQWLLDSKRTPKGADLLKAARLVLAP